MKLNTGIFFGAILLLSGCGTSWINVDGSKADRDRINQAKALCNHDSTLAGLQAREVKKEAQLITTSDIAKKQALEEAYLRDEKKTYARLDSCMQKQGLKPLYQSN